MDNNMVDDLAEWLNSDEAKLEFNKYRKTQDIYSAQRDRYMGLWKTLTKAQRTNILRKLSAFDYHDNKYINIMQVINSAVNDKNMFKQCNFPITEDDDLEIVYDIDGIALYHTLMDLWKITMIGENDIIPHICEDIVMDIYFDDERLFWTGTSKATAQDIYNQIINKNLTGYTICFSNEPNKKYEINKYFIL